MNFSTEIVLYDTGKNGVIYALHLAGDPESEFDKFIKDYPDPDDPLFHNVLTVIANIAHVSNPGEPKGFRRGLFRHEFGNEGYAIPHWHDDTEVRVFTIRLNEYTLILCGGIYKNYSGSTQGNKTHDEYREFCATIEDAITRKLSGNLETREDQFLGGIFEKGTKRMTKIKERISL